MKIAQLARFGKVCPELYVGRNGSIYITERSSVRAMTSRFFQ